MFTIYAPAGAQAKKLRASFLQDLAFELHAWPDQGIAFLGDFQDYLPHTAFFLELSALGWRALVTYDEHNNFEPPTYQSGDVSTIIDNVVVSLAFDENLHHAVTRPLPGLLHSVVTCAIQVHPTSAYPRIAYPPNLRYPQVPVNQQELWDETCSQIASASLIAGGVVTFELPMLTFELPMLTFELPMLTFELPHAPFCRNTQILVAQRST